MSADPRKIKTIQEAGPPKNNDHLNIRSLCKHINELHNLLDNIPFELDIIACSETWITPQVDPESIKIAGYNLLTDDRNFLLAAGLLYI